MTANASVYVSTRMGTDTAYNVIFHPGQHIVLQFHKNSLRYKSHVVGVERYRYAMCKMPLSPGVSEALSVGAGMTVRFENSGTVYGFHSRLVECILKPSKMLVFSYPNRIETVKLRNHARVNCMLPVVVSCGNHYTFDGFLGDISQSGCRMIVVHGARERVRNLIMDGDVVEMKLPLDGLRHHTCRAVLKTIRNTSRALVMGFSFEFPGGTPRSLARFVNHMLAASSENEAPVTLMN